MGIPALKQERFHFLDGLRGIASLMIVFHHSCTANIVKFINYLKIPFLGSCFSHFTQSGVELFFVLSGIVLLRPYLRKQRKFKVGDYFIRRIKRIYPPYLVALIFAGCVSWYINAYPTWYTFTVYHMKLEWTELFKESFIISFNERYYNLACWSLSIEVLFYLLVPFCVILFPSREKINNRLMMLMLLSTLVVSVSIQLWLTQYHPEIYTYNHINSTAFLFIAYPVCFLLGILLAAKDFGRKEAYSFIITGIFFIAASLLYMPLGNPGYGFVYAGIVILSFNSGSFKHFLSKPIMLWIGERSYSLFLVHFPVFYLTDQIVANLTPGRNAWYAIMSRGIGLPMALFAAMLLFHFVERRQARGLITGDIFWPWQVKYLNRSEVLQDELVMTGTPKI